MSRIKINVDELVNKRLKKRKKRDLNETVFYEINDKKVSVFTPEFLEENRLIEGELRKLRRENNDFEEHNSVLINYIESLTSACDQARDELQDLEGIKTTLSRELDRLQNLNKNMSNSNNKLNQ